MERLSWRDQSGVLGKAVVDAAVEHHHANGQVTYMAEIVRCITREADAYRIDLEGGRQSAILIPEEWVTAAG